MKINDVEYIEKSKYDELKKEKIILSDYGVYNYPNIWGIVPIIKCDNQKEIEEIEIEDVGFFKKIKNPKIILKTPNFTLGEKYIVENTCYSKEYIDKIMEMGQIMFNEFEIYMAYDKEQNEFINDRPILIIFENKMCFILAPRVEMDEGEE